MSLAWWDPANWPPCPALFGNIQVSRAIPGLIWFEDFEAYVAGLPLAGQGAWHLVPGSGANPAVVVDGTGLIGGANSALLTIGGAPTTALATEFNLPGPVDGTNPASSIEFKARTDVALLGSKFLADFTHGAYDLVAFATRAFAIAIRYQPIILDSSISFYDFDDPGGSPDFLVGVPGGVPFTVGVVFTGGGAYNWTINGVPSGQPDRHMFAANASIDRYSLANDGNANDAISAFDEFTFTGPAAPVDIGTSIMLNGETSQPLVTGGWNGATIQVSQMPGGAFDAAASVLVEHSLDGVHWFTVIAIPGNAAGSEIGTIGQLVTTMIRFTVSLPNDVANAGVIIVGVDR